MIADIRISGYIHYNTHFSDNQTRTSSLYEHILENVAQKHIPITREVVGTLTFMIFPKGGCHDFHYMPKGGCLF